MTIKEMTTLELTEQYLDGEDGHRDELTSRAEAAGECLSDYLSHYVDEDGAKLLALLEELECEPSEVCESRDGAIYGLGFRYGNQEWAVLTDDEADDAWDEALESYLDDCIMPVLPEMAQRYFDSDSWKREAKMDGRGPALSVYDGKEREQQVGGQCFFIYHTN